VNFGSNDYLGLAAEELLPAVCQVLTKTGWGAGASPLVTGRGHWHMLLEQRLAEFEGTEAALLFPSGYSANVGVIPALVGKEDIIFSDAKNHASIVDGCRLSGARIAIYAHANASHLAQLVQQAGAHRRRLIVSDSLFSMDGDLAPLRDLCEIAERSDAMLMVDEAHATGVFGARGRGLTELLEVEDGVHVRVGTLSKALGSLGGFVAGSRPLVQWLSNRARSYVFSTAAPEALAAAGCHALQIVAQQPQRRQQLLARAELLRQQLQSQGWNVGRSLSQIIPVILGDPQRTMLMATRLREEGLLVPGIRPPTVPVGQSLLRISLTAAHTPEQIDRLVAAFGELGGIGR
jgi:8-amino-7-oxononanoate synthase